MREARHTRRLPPRPRGNGRLRRRRLESFLHDEAVTLLEAILDWWARGRDAHVARNVAVRWDEEEPRVGTDPDVCVLTPPPPRVEGNVRSVRTWLPGHEPPLVAVEIVSETNPRKDYAVAPEKYAASGTRELWIFDPLLAGPQSHGGPFRLQLWRRDESGSFVQVHAGEGPFYSEAVGGFLVATDDELEAALRARGG